MKAERHETTAGVKVGCVELQTSDDCDGKDGYGGLPDDNNHVTVGQEFSAGEIDRGEQHH